MTGGVPQTAAQGKMYVSAVLLPDGKVFETGGALHNRADPVYEASMFDPATGRFAAGMATAQITVDGPIRKASLIRPEAVTHSSDPNQRYVTGGRRTLVGLGVLGVLAAGVWLVVAPGEHDASPVSAPAAPAPGRPTFIRPLLAAGPSARPSATPAAVTEVPSSPPTAAAPPIAKPFVQDFAVQPGVKPLKALPSPTGTTDKCAWLAEHGFTKLAVAAADRQQDTDGNRIACDT